MKKKFIPFLLACLSIFSGFVPVHILGAASANLNQSKNGTDASPTTPVQWVNGNLGSNNTHYIEGMSVSYNCIMTGLTAGVQITLTMGYDNKNSSKHAIDYLTHYNRMTPHNFPSHSTAETIDPLTGSGLASNTPFTTYAIPVPSSTNSPAVGQPAASFNSLPANERLMTLYNGTLDSIYYVSQGDLTVSQAETQITVKFTPSSTTAVLAWGGHIGSRNDWGYTGGSPRSAGGISGSPFHMRMISWNLGSIGNQDRSLSGASVGIPPNPLPVELVRFSVHAEENKNIIEWTTASEINCDYFTLERSTDARNYETLEQIIAAGNSTSIRNYTVTEDLPFSGITYYRLTETDFDGMQKIFGPISFRNDHSQESLSEFKIHYASNSKSYFSFYSGSRQPVLLEIINTQGQRIYSATFDAEKGSNLSEIRIDAFPSNGIYFLRLYQGDTSSSARLVVNR